MAAFNALAVMLYPIAQINREPDYATKLTDLAKFFTFWAQAKLNINLTLTPKTIAYGNDAPPDSNDKYGIADMYKVLNQYYNAFDFWLVFAPYYTPRPLRQWAGFYDWGKMVYVTYVDNDTLIDEEYVTSEELLHALLNKIGKPDSIAVELVHTNRSAGLADFWGERADGSYYFIQSGTTKTDVPERKHITVGGDYV